MPELTEFAVLQIILSVEENLSNLEAQRSALWHATSRALDTAEALSEILPAGPQAEALLARAKKLADKMGL